MSDVPGLSAPISPVEWDELMRKLNEYLDPLRNSGLTIVEKVQAWYRDLVAQLERWLRYLMDMVDAVKRWAQGLVELWNKVVAIAQQTYQRVKNLVTDVPLMFALYDDLQRWIQIQRDAQGVSARVQSFHLDNGFKYGGSAGNRRWNGRAAESYVAAWPSQVTGANRLAQTAGDTIFNLARLLTAGVAVYVAWGMVVLELVMITVNEAVLSRWLGPVGAGGEIRTLIALVATAELADRALQVTDRQTAELLKTTAQNRQGLQSGDRNWPNPLNDKEFIHSEIEGGKVRIVGGAPLKTNR
jgi:hypothetical protein